MSEESEAVGPEESEPTAPCPHNAGTTFTKEGNKCLLCGDFVQPRIQRDVRNY